jgi:hypothetical protein
MKTTILSSAQAGTSRGGLPYHKLSKLQMYELCEVYILHYIVKLKGKEASGIYSLMQRVRTYGPRNPTNRPPNDPRDPPLPLGKLAGLSDAERRRRRRAAEKSPEYAAKARRLTRIEEACFGPKRSSGRRLKDREAEGRRRLKDREAEGRRRLSEREAEGRRRLSEREAEIRQRERQVLRRERDQCCRGPGRRNQGNTVHQHHFKGTSRNRGFNS